MPSAPAVNVPISSARPRTGGSALILRLLYPLLTILLIGMVLKGFWPSYFGQLLPPSVSRHWIIHLHAAVFSGWMVLLLVQVVLISGRRVRWHRRVGRLGIVCGVMVLAIGLIVSFAAPAMHVRNGDWPLDQAAGFLILPLFDMVLFAGFFLAAVSYRNQPQTHKRLILAATVALAFAAVARIGFASPLIFFLVWLSPIFLAIVADLVSSGRIHRVNLVAAGVLSLAFVRIFFQESEGWLRIGRALLKPFV